MTKAYRAEAREHLKNCVGARFSAEALVIALTGGRIGQSDWSLECDRIISLLDDDADYRRGFEDGLKANTRAAFAAAKQAIPERTCHLSEKNDICSSCGACIQRITHSVYEMGDGYACRPNYCPNCGAKVVN